jgi:hypothetical protein
MTDAGAVFSALWGRLNAALGEVLPDAQPAPQAEAQPDAAVDAPPASAADVPTAAAPDSPRATPAYAVPPRRPWRRRHCRKQRQQASGMAPRPPRPPDRGCRQTLPHRRSRQTPPLRLDRSSSTAARCAAATDRSVRATHRPSAATRERPALAAPFHAAIRASRRHVRRRGGRVTRHAPTRPEPLRAEPGAPASRGNARGHPMAAPAF